MQISFIVPVYNLVARGYLYECLRSLERCKIPGMEVWVIDDGSTDGSGEVCDDFSSKDMRFHVIHQQNAGVSAARNEGIQHSTGDWLFFLDGDDLIPDGIEKAFTFESFEQADVVFFSYVRLNNDGEPLKKERNNEIQPQVMISQELAKQLPGVILEDNRKPDPNIAGINLKSVSGKAYRRSFIIENNICFHEGVFRAEDMLFALQVALCEPRYLRSYEIAYYYRVRNGSTTDSYQKDVMKNGLRVIDYGKQLLKEHNLENRYSNVMNTLVAYSFLSCVIFDFCHPDNPKCFRIRQKEFQSARSTKLFGNSIFKLELKTIKPFGSRSRITVILCRMRAFLLLSVYLTIVRKIRDLKEKRHRA